MITYIHIHSLILPNTDTQSFISTSTKVAFKDSILVLYIYDIQMVGDTMKDRIGLNGYGNFLSNEPYSEGA